MAYAYSCERILATVDWAHAELKEQKKSSGYAMDSLFKTYSKGDPRPGKFARYLRGDNTPNDLVLREMMFDHNSEAIERMHLPLYDVLARGHAELLLGNSELEVLFDIERRLDFRLTGYYSDLVIETVEVTPSRALTLAAYANSYALAALLVWAPCRQYSDSDEKLEGSKACLVIGQRAFQCLILAVANGEFPQTGPVLTARIRQRVLDQLKWRHHRLDTASVDIAAAVEAGRRLLAQARVQPTLGKRRSALRKLLARGDAADLDAITPKIVPDYEAEAARRQNPVKLAFGQRSNGKKNQVGGYGASARRELRTALGDYSCDE